MGAGTMQRIRRAVQGATMRWAFVLAPAALSGSGAEAAETIKVGVYENHPKIYTTPEGQISGFFPALLDHLALQEGWQIQYVPGTWQECLDRLARGEINLMPDVALTPERQDRYDFNEETALLSWAAVYTRPDVQVQSFFDLSGRRIALMKGSVYSSGGSSITQLLGQLNIAANYQEYPSYRDVLKALADRAADAGVVNNIFGSYFEKEFNVVRSPILFSPSQLRFAFTKNDPQGKRVARILDERLRALKKDQTSFYYDAIDQYLFGTPHATARPAPSDWKSVLSPAERDWIAQHPEIRVGIDPEFYPFEYRDEEQAYQGISSDYMSLFAKRLGLNLKVEQGLAWTTVVARARAGEIDVLPCVGFTEERTNFLLYSKPYIKFQGVILTRSDMPFIAGLQDIESARVAVQSGSMHEGFLRERSSIRPICYPSLEECLLALSAGKVDAVVGNLASSAYWIRKLNLINLKVAAPSSMELGYLHVAVRKDWPELLSIINKGLDLVSSDEQRAIEQRWVAVEFKSGIEPRVAWRVGLRIAAAVALILAAILTWAYRLKKEIRRRREIERQLNFREHFERLVSETSSRIITLQPKDIDNHIRVTLAELVCFTNATAAYMYTIGDDGIPVRTHAGGDMAALEAAGFRPGPGPHNTEWLDRLKAEQAMVFHGGEDPRATGVALATADAPPIAGTVVEVPCVSEQRVTGFLGLLDSRRGQQPWSAEDLSLLRLLGQILTNALRRKTTEEAMARYASELENANRQLQDLDRLKNLFIASVSHELRTPLNSIIGFTGVILKGMSGNLTDKQRDQLTRVKGSAEHLLELITDIIDISKIEAGRIDSYPQPFLLEDVIKESIESIRPQLTAKGLALETDVAPGVEVFTDRKRLRQCLLNYLSNAVKYSEHGVVKVASRDMGDRFEISVSDLGIGISPQDRQRLFEPFVRLDSHLRIKAGGTGLGLYLTRKIALEILKGDISVVSEKGRGSTFSLHALKRLPAEAGPARKGEPSSHETRSDH